MNEEKRSIKIVILGIIALIIASFVSLFLGRYTVSPLAVIDILFDKIMGTIGDDVSYNVILDIRLPRIFLNILVGAGLSISGAAFQGIFQNRLVSSDILGVSNGAGFGAALGMFLGSNSPLGVTTMAFIGGIASVTLTYSISKIKKDNSTLTLVLSGIIVASFFSALISFIKLVADTDSVLPSITYWLMGSFSGATNEKIFFASSFIVIGIIIIFSMRWKINVLSMGDEEAYTLGLNPAKNRFVIIAACTFVTAACVTVTGIIGWVGMIMPNMCREYISANNKILIPASAIFGSLFMVIVDFIARFVTAAEIPIGILTAVIGAPIFVLIFFKREGELN